MIGNIAKRILVPEVRSIIQKRSDAIVSGPPTVHVSKAEKYGLGLFMAACFLFTPTWVLLHIRDYKSSK